MRNNIHSKSRTAGETIVSKVKHAMGIEDTKLREFFVDSLRDIYWAEKHILKALPKMRKAASCLALIHAFDKHFIETEGQVEKLEAAFSFLGENPRGKKCEAIVGIVKEGEEIISETDAGTATRDVGLILAAQKVEHYEIATYGGLAQLARTLGETEVAKILEDILEEEKGADVSLTEIAEDHVNYEAAAEDDDAFPVKQGKSSFTKRKTH